MAGELVSFGIQKLWDLLSQECERFQGVEDQVTGLKRDLNLLSSFLEDAYAKKHTTAVVRTVLEEIQEIVYDAGDIIETYLLKEKLRKTSGIRMSIRRHACFISDRRRYALDIGGIHTKISDVIRIMQSFGVQQAVADGGYMQPQGDRQRDMRQKFPNEYESDFVGLEANVKKLVGMVEKDDIQIISVTGMGGLGKTTLARQVFNHEDVKQQFNQRLAWVCLSQEFTRISVWQTILQNLTSKERKDEILNMKEAELQDELFRLLETSKSLIVFDDIWREEDWDLIKPIFPPKKGWKVLLTSRNESVAMHGDTTYINFKPECLTIKDSWTLFQRIAMPRKDAPEFKIDEEMEEMGRQMIKHCGGLPLAIKVLGGLLAAKYTVHGWKRLSENIGSHLVGGRTDFNDDNNNSINYVLSLSFEELPSYLKHCFLYLAHFPEDHTIDVEELSYYWAAEEISEPRRYNGETIRDVGDSYIEELVRRNMVLSERDDMTLRFETCHLHDMMREVCLFKAKEENFLQITSSSPPTANFQSYVKSRRLVSHNPTTLHVERDINNPKLRSLVVFQVNEPWGEIWKLSGSSYTRLELLRVLDLCNAKFRERKLASGIGKLIHLRYLSLKGAEVSHLPSSLGNLLLLIYLNLDTLGSIFVPNVLMGMQELRYLALPIPMHEKTKLELGNLVNLETLVNFSTKNSSVRDLQRMIKLRTLSIKIRGKGCATETLSSSLTKLRHLEDLSIYDFPYDYGGYGGSMNDEKRFALDCIHLKELKLKIYMPRLPDEQHFPSRLTYISLEACRLVEDPMPILEKLVQLIDLILWHQSFSGRRMLCSSGGFPKLQKLEVFGLDEWEEWIVEEGSMPLLHTLHIWDCPKLKKLPAGGFPRLQTLKLFGLEEWEEWIVEEGSMPLLHFMYVGDCKKLKKLPDGLSLIYSLKDLRMDKEWKERLSEGGEDYYKVQHIPSVKFNGL